MLLGNKEDLSSSREVSKEKAEEMSKSMGV